MLVELTFNDEECGENFNIEINHHVLLKECQKWSKYKDKIIEALVEDYGIDDDEIEELEYPYKMIQDTGRGRRKELALDGLTISELVRKITKEVNK